ncbi:MAG: prepilin-type N-terminal cleavage/methylation domain-containing protein [Myxococcota bacterium]
MFDPPPSSQPPRMRQRGVTLIEVLVVLAIVAVMAGGAMLGLGAIDSARLRESSTVVSGAIRIAYAHANVTSKATRLVFDFENQTIRIEDSEGALYVKGGELNGGAASANELEAAAQAESESILKGPQAPRPRFSPIKGLLGFSDDEKAGPAAKRLKPGIAFRQVEVSHEESPVTEGFAYLYFWPGGLTQRAAVQVQRRGGEEDSDIITVLVSPLTGKTAIEGGAIDMPRPTSDDDASEREDSL